MLPPSKVVDLIDPDVEGACNGDRSIDPRYDATVLDAVEVCATHPSASGQRSIG
jgi:hypothetical protein